ncbi:TPA: tyrosine-type recombinase/integrase [Legionella pneumophila]|uniref:Tyrosine recombinase XerD n=1 Tax=Legionella steelei TaxID=947033 RepID=A0A0W0ZS56_9GAMM|nr:site-specific integrase [Legionella steelei]KTD71850.1 Tyrosine recombinase XerD [Legionella steelei]
MTKKDKAKILSEAEFEQLLVAAKIGSSSIRNVALVYCSFGLGLRVKEIASLTIKDVANSQYRLRDEICLKRSITVGKKQHHVYLTNKKVYSALTDHLKNMEGVGLNKPLFQTQRKKEFTPCTLQKWFRSLYDKAGIYGASSHSGRRTFITRLIEQGVNIKSVSHLAGHASTITTSIYIENKPDCLKELAKLAVF